MAKYEFCPMINQIQKLEEEDVDAKMIKGPEITNEDFLMVSQEDMEVEKGDSGFDFSIRVFVNQNQIAPDIGSLNRTQINVPSRGSRVTFED